MRFAWPSFRPESFGGSHQTMPTLGSEVYRLVRTLETSQLRGDAAMVVRVEIFQSSTHPNRYRFWYWGLETFNIATWHHDQPLPHFINTTLSLPNLGKGYFFEAASLEEAERISLARISAV